MEAVASHDLHEGLSHDVHRGLKGIVILRHSPLVSERYFNGDSADTLHDIRSTTKSITAVLMGIAIQRGYVRSVGDSMAAYQPKLPHDGKQEITIRELLNMRSGLDADDEGPNSPGNDDRLGQSTARATRFWRERS